LQNKPVVPLNISLNSSQRILIISGPNAGGKSVCLKTTGLLQYMFQCSLLPPVHQDSEFGLFHRICIDIGDEQSLENDLSTYSSKLLNLKFFIENLDGSSLFLIDELGTGTDPSLGGTIAEASLEKINEKSPFGVVTTHYSNLKLLSERCPGIENAAMLYDTLKMKPLFILQAGIPGSSFAFEIARQIGFPDDVLENAAQKTGQTQLNFDRQLQDLEIEKTEMIRKGTEVKVADDFLHELISKYQKLHDDLKKREEEIIRKAKEEALSILKESNKQIEKTIKEIRESQADKSKTLTARKELQEFKEELAQSAFSSQQSAVPSQQSAVSSSQSAVSSQKSAVPSQQSAVPSPPVRASASSTAKPYKTYIDDLDQKLINYHMTLDLRGKRADEALSMLQRYIDDAILLNMNEVRILHGKGNGILRQVTRDYLRSIKEIKKYQDAPLEQGGAGITVVLFR
jgi:DNA mismatch repair protein MutS2